MSEPILKALIQLFALISDVHSKSGITTRGKDIVRLFLSLHLNNDLVIRYMEMFDEYLDLYHSENIAKGSIKDRKRTSLTAVRILGICEKINEELHLKQKLFVIVQLIDFILFSTEITENELDFLETVSNAFNIPEEEYWNINNFILSSVDDIPDKRKVMIIDNKSGCKYEGVKHLYKENLGNTISLLYIAVTNTFILRHSGKEDLFLNGQNIFEGQTYTFDHGSTIRSPGINTIYYNDISSVFTEEAFKIKISIDATDVNLRFKNSDNGIHKLSFHEESGTLVGILGGSGVGKSTLLNVLSGITEPQSGEVLINGYNLYSDKERDNLKGVIGFVPQDDLLIEELTVFQNLYYSARMCLDNLPADKLKELVDKTLIELDLNEIRDLRVGSPLNKVISGGQRKRLNIALELIREPTILFVDEPTSGLSSVDSEIVMNLLKEQTYLGKLVIINIHQPGSEIYKMFDKIMIIDKGGYQIFYGNPSEAIIYFKTKSKHASADEDRCNICGNVNTEQLLQIIEAKVVNENGKPTHIRKISPKEWAEKFQPEIEKIKQKTNHGFRTLPENNYSIPGMFKQSKIYFLRDLLSKLPDKQYLLLALLGAPLLALLLSYFTKYVNGDYYLFSDNDNLPAYLFTSVITILFLGLIISAEEIIKDRKILKRESFLNLSWFSYLNSKVMMMFLISAIQTITFIIIGNIILEIRGMTLSYWIILFSTSCLANLIGLNISSAFNSVITIYILLPFIIIPQLLFSGVMVKFDKLHTSKLSSEEYVPIIGEMMAARWSFEALAVEQFKNNKFERNFFSYEMEDSQNTWYSEYLIYQLEVDLNKVKKSASDVNITENSFKRLNYHTNYLSDLTGISIPDKLKTSLNNKNLDSVTVITATDYFDHLTRQLRGLKEKAITSYNIVTDSITRELGEEGIARFKENYYNKRLAEHLMNDDVRDKSLITSDRIIQKYKPIMMKPLSKYGRAQFYAPYKQIGNIKIDTFWFNLLVLWMVTFILYIALYYKLLQKGIKYLENMRLPIPD